MKIREIEAYFESLYPKKRGCAWDNDGLMICPDREREVKRILTCLDVTFSAIEKAISEKCELIISHHPLIFSPLKNVTEDTLVGQKALLLLGAGISLLSLHTRFDGAIGGLNERFAKDLGIFPEQGIVLLEEEPYIGGVGNLAGKMSPKEFANLVSQALSSPVKLYSADLDVLRIGYCCGSGKDLIAPCLLDGVDAFVGGDIPYHIALDAVEKGMTVIDCGHYASEKKSAKIFRENLFALSSEFEVVSFNEELGGEFVNFS